MGTEPVSPCTISTFSIGTPSVSATSWEKVVSWPWPWLCEPVKMVTEPVGLKRTCADSQRPTPDRKSVVEGKSVSVRVDLGGRRIIKKKKKENITTNKTRNN